MAGTHGTKTTMATPKEKNDATTQSTTSISMKMCPELKEFYERHGLDGAEQLVLNASQHAPSRFIRLNPRYDKQATLRLLEVCFEYWFVVIVVSRLNDGISCFAFWLFVSDRTW